MSRIRKSFSGAAVPTNLNGAITSAAASANVTAIVNFPNTSTGPFVITIDRGGSAEEKILCSSYSANTINFVQRGYDGTTAQGHANGAPVVCTIDADTVDGANDYMAGNGTVAPHASAPGDAAAKGSALYAAAADHVHAREAWGTGQSQQVGSANADGVQTTLARSDHIHQGVTSFNTRQGLVTPGNADYLAVATGGLTGATSATRFVGCTASGPPVSGTFAKADFVVDQTGAMFVCITAGSPGTWVNVGVGANPAGRLNQPNPQPIPINTVTNITGMVQDFVAGGMTSSVSGTGQLIAPVAGKYRISGQVAFNLNGTVQVPTNGARLICFIAINGAQTMGGEMTPPGYPNGVNSTEITGFPSPSVSTVRSLNANDAVSLQTYQNMPGLGQNTTPTTELCMELVSR